jgi:hypothetical protein
MSLLQPKDTICGYARDAAGYESAYLIIKSYGSVAWRGLCNGGKNGRTELTLALPMSGLARDAAAFKSVLSRQDYTSWHSQPPQSGAADSTTLVAGSSSSKKKRPKTSTFFSCCSTRFVRVF